MVVAESSVVARQRTRCGAPLSLYNPDLTCAGCNRANEAIAATGERLSRPTGVPADDSGAVLRAWRASTGRSQVETAERLGMTQQNLSQIKNGRQTMSYEQRQRAAGLVGVLTVEVLVVGADGGLVVSPPRCAMAYGDHHLSAVGGAESEHSWPCQVGTPTGRYRQRSPRSLPARPSLWWASAGTFAECSVRCNREAVNVNNGVGNEERASNEYRNSLRR